MTDSSTSTSISISLLNNSNYTTWKSDITAVLRCKGLFRLVNGTVSKPSDKPEDAIQLESYLDKLDRAAGLLVLHVDKDQRVHLAGIEDDSLPCGRNWRRCICPERLGQDSMPMMISDNGTGQRL